MSLWRPDPTFYPSPKLAMLAPPEKLAYVAMLNANGEQPSRCAGRGGCRSRNPAPTGVWSAS